jgi:ferredoxin
MQWGVRWLCLAAALFLLLGGPVPAWAARVLPGLSPLVVLSAALAARTWYATLFWSLPVAAVLGVAVIKGRWFCHWVCPMGTLSRLVSGRLPPRRLVRRHYRVHIFWATVAASALGVPLLLFLDPLSMSSRTFALLNGGFTVAALVPGLLLPLFLVWAVFQPMAWCTHLCPLGYLFGLVHQRGVPTVHRVDRHRRAVLQGLGVGALLALGVPRLPQLKRGGRRQPILPPGALDAEAFASTCSRCGVCVETCPTHAIQAQFDVRQSVAQWFQPEIVPEYGGCEEFCTACTHVCPTGALRSLGEEEKRHRRLGKATVVHERCLAWEEGEYCTICDEYCPYNAIEVTESEEGIPLPEVNHDLCRGCGICQYECPVEEGGKAIVVEGLDVQEIVEA